MVKTDLEKNLHIKEMELISLLEVTQAINANLPEDSLYKIYHFISIGSLQIKKLALYVHEQEWVCKVNYGTEKDFRNIPFPESFLSIQGISNVDFPSNFKGFEIVIPIAHKDIPLAYVFLSGEEDGGITDTSFIQTITSVLIVAIENKKLARKQLQQEALRKELEIAREVQTMLFPKELPFHDRLKIQATYLPHTTVGGDYYDYIPLDDHRFITCIADVSGKGIPASLLMANFQASLRTLVRKTTNLTEIVTELNYIIKNNAKGDRFITFFVAEFDLKNKYFKYINAGHNPPVLAWQNGETEILERGTIVLGAFDNLPFVEEDTVAITGPMLLFAYTDGLTETSNEQDEEFGIEGVKNFLKIHDFQSLETMHTSIQDQLKEFKGTKEFPDDITYLTCFVS